MYFLYVDESGDTGRKNNSSPIFVLSGLVVHELAWFDVHELVLAFRKRLVLSHQFSLQSEIHCAEMIQSGDPKLRYRHIQVLKQTLQFIESLGDATLINVVVHKQSHPAAYDVFWEAWKSLLTAFHDLVSLKEIRGPQNPKDHGVVIADDTDANKLRGLLRKLRQSPSASDLARDGSAKSLPFRTIIEDVSHRSSKDSYFLQLVDVCAYFLYQKETAGNKFLREKGGKNYFTLLNSVLCRAKCLPGKDGIVRLGNAKGPDKTGPGEP